MLRLLKKSWWAILLAVGLQSASGFALLGIREAYQVDSLTYLLGFSDQAKNIDQGFRWSVPTNYYTFDPTFVSYFGSNGMWSVEQGYCRSERSDECLQLQRRAGRVPS